MSIERLHSIHRSPVSLFDSSWDCGSWDDFGHTLRSMERRMREMDRQFEQMFQQFLRLTPVSETRQTERIRDKRDRFSTGFFSDDFDALAYGDRSESPTISGSKTAIEGASSSRNPRRSLMLARQGSYDFGFPDAPNKDPIVTNKDGKKVLRLQYDVRQFKPEEITVKTLDNQLEVLAKHEMEDANHKVYREYRRVYTLPKEVEPETLSSTFSPEGVLSIEAPIPEKIQSIEAPEEISKPVPIPIQHQKSNSGNDK